MTMTERKVGVIGWPVEHSLSPVMHNAAFAALGLAEWHYDRIPVPPDIVRLSIRELRDHGYVGINVTIPHKQEALYACKPDETAQRIGAGSDGVDGGDVVALNGAEGDTLVKQHSLRLSSTEGNRLQQESHADVADLAELR